MFVRKSSSYWTHLERLNQRFVKNRNCVVLKAAPEDLQDDDLLEMVNAGLVDIIVVDRYQALLWAKVFKKLKPHKDIVIDAGGDLAWMIRKDSPKLKADIAEFANSYGRKSDFGNDLVKKYGGDGNPRVVKQATSNGEIKKFQQTSILSQIRHPVRHGLSLDGRPGLSGIPPRSKRPKQCGGDRSHATHARDGRRHEDRRRYPA